MPLRADAALPGPANHGVWEGGASKRVPEAGPAVLADWDGDSVTRLHLLVCLCLLQ